MRSCYDCGRHASLENKGMSVLGDGFEEAEDALPLLNCMYVEVLSSPCDVIEGYEWLHLILQTGRVDKSEDQDGVVRLLSEEPAVHPCPLVATTQNQ